MVASPRRRPSGWEVADHAIVRRRESGDIVTVAAFADFELSTEWKICAGANSGIIYRAALSAGETRRTGPEYQIIDVPP
ncbi:MAG: 3-keto-disaccharide hydrolase [Opitutaceae bacterium]